MIRLTRTSIALLVVTLFVACAGDKKSKILENLQNDWKAENLSSPIVEAYIEYGSAEQEWLGHETLTLHVYAKDSQDGKAIVSVTPSRLALQIEKRAPANDEAKQGITVAIARDRLQELSKNMSEKTMPLADVSQSVRYLASVALPMEKQGGSCNYPIRVWMARANGAVLEKHGCRYHDSWSASVSQATTDFLMTIGK